MASISASDFKEKTTGEVAVYLGENGVPLNVCDIIEENDVDGEAFLDLSEDDLKSIVSKLGIVKKIIRLQKALTAVPPSTPNTQNQSPLSPHYFRKSTTPLSPQSPFSPSSAYESDDSVSTLSSASALSKGKFSIPDSWPPAIMSCINKSTDEERKLALEPPVRCEIVRVLGTQMFCFNPKPTKELCTEVAKALVKKYPFLKDTGDKVSGYGSWEKKLIEKVHNLKARKSKRPLEDGDSTPKAKRGRPKMLSVLARYPPLKDSVDDDISIERHFAQLEKELEKESPRKDVVLSLARQTFQSRRASILSDSTDVTAGSLLDQFKELRKSYVIEQEFDLILDMKDICETAQLNWKTKWVPAIFKYANSSAGKKLLAALEQAEKDFADDEFKKDKTALLVLCKALCKKSVENPLMYIYEDCKLTDDPSAVASAKPTRSAPRIACFRGAEQSQFFIFVEGRTLCVLDSLVKALIVWFATHYVLNLEYCVKVKEVALFYQEFVFNLPATSNTKKQKTSTYLVVTTDVQNCVESS